VLIGEFAKSLLELAPPLPEFDMPLLDAHGATLARDLFDGERRVLESGARIRATQIGLAAQLGLDHLPTRPLPRTVVVAFGDQDRHTTGSAVNSWLVTTAVKEAGSHGYRVFLPASTGSARKAILEDQLVRADLLLVSAGDEASSFDEVLETMQRIGEVQEIELNYRGAGRHGYGVIGPDKTPAVLLPNDPIAAYKSTELFIRPMIRNMMGLYELHRPIKRMLTRDSIMVENRQADFILSQSQLRDGVEYVSALADQSSMVALAAANSMIAIPANLSDENTMRTIESDFEVEVISLDRRYL
jgi:molybdopterin molybdotransferase